MSKNNPFPIEEIETHLKWLKEHPEEQKDFEYIVGFDSYDEDSNEESKGVKYGYKIVDGVVEYKIIE